MAELVSNPLALDTAIENPTNDLVVKMLGEIQLLNLDGLQADTLATQQPRSKFALERFVVGQHPTPIRQLKQCIIELRSKLNQIRRALIQRKIVCLQIAKLRESGDEIKQLKADLAEIGLEESDLGLVGTIQEFKALFEIWKALDLHPTAEEFEQDEQLYWFRRLSHQADLDLASRDTGISYGNLQALEQAGFCQIKSSGQQMMAPAQQQTQIEQPACDIQLGTQVVIG